MSAPVNAILQDKRQIFLMLYAQRAFQLAHEAASYIVESNLKKGDKLFYPLLCSVSVNYSRPFKRSKLIGALPIDMIPTEYVELHKTIIEMRDTIFAHSDGNSPSSGWGPLNQIRYRKTGNKITPLSLEIQGSVEALQATCVLCSILIDKASYHLNRLHQKNRRSFPKDDGEYLLTITDDATTFMVPAAPLEGATHEEV